MKMNHATTVVLKYVLFTILGCSLLMGSSFLVLSWFMPRLVADISYDLGFQNITLHYYEITYDKPNDNDYLYNAVIVSVFAENDEKTISLYEELLAQEQYASLMQEIDQNTKEQDTSNLQKSLLLYEDNYLKNEYITALMQENEFQKALAFAKQYTNLDTVTFGALTPYLYTFVFTTDNFSQTPVTAFAQGEWETGVLVSQKLSDYYEEMYDLFLLKYADASSLTNLEKSEMLVLGRRIGYVANNLLAMNQVVTPVISNETVATIASDVYAKLNLFV